MSDSTLLDAAVVEALQGDSQLATLAPGGVWPDIADESTPTPLVIVSLDEHLDVYEQGGLAYEDAVYRIVVCDKALDAAAANAAFLRLHAVLDAAFTITGYHVMAVFRIGRFRLAERTGSDIWRFVGATYRLQADPTS